MNKIRARKAKRTYRVLGTLVLNGAGGNDVETFAKRKAIALWLRRQAHSVIMHGNQYSRRFTAQHYWPNERSK